MSESRIYRRGILTIVSAILAISLFCLTLAVVVIIQFGVEVIPLKAVKSTPYYSDQSAALESRVKDLTRQCGLPESIVDQVFDSDEILAFTKEYTANSIRDLRILWRLRRSRSGCGRTSTIIWMKITWIWLPWIWKP